MKVATDTSVFVAVVANEPEKVALIRQTQGAELFAPASLPWEVGNAFAAMLKRGRITVAQAKSAVEAFDKIAVSLIDVDLSRAVELAGRLNIYAYDAYVIVVAQDLNCSLLTLDSGLIRAAKAVGVPVLEVENDDANLS